MQKILQKNYDFGNWKKIFECQKVIGGPMKIEHANRIMYVVKNFSNGKEVKEDDLESSSMITFDSYLDHEKLKMKSARKERGNTVVSCNVNENDIIEVDYEQKEFDRL